MKQKYSSLFFYLKNIRLSKYLKFFISTIFIFLFHSSFGQQVIITGIVDGTLSGGNPKGIELYIDGAVDLSSYQLWNQVMVVLSLIREHSLEIIPMNLFI